MQEPLREDQLREDQLPPGTVIGGYRLAGLLGRGGMGVVYRAEQLSIGRPVALKVLLRRRMRERDKLDKFFAEARAAGRLSHLNLVTVHDVGFDEVHRLGWYSMECVQGRSLTAAVSQDGPLDGRRVLGLGIQLAEALSHAHRAGLIHRDLKPDNVLLAPGDRIKLLDLGLATDLAEGVKPASGAGRMLTVIGTPGWSAPEQVRNPARANASSDVFALGCVLLYALTGQDPFRGETLIDLAVRVCLEEPFGLAALPPQLGDRIAPLLEKDPADRPANGAEALALLRDGPSADEASSSSSATRSIRRRRYRRR